MKKLLLTLLIILLLTTSAQAQVQSSNPTGGEKNIFYTNETVYITTTSNITTTSIQVRIYIVNNNNTWENNTILNDVAEGYKTISTNSTGHIPVTAVWSSNLRVGKYDIVVDVNQNGTYESGTDYIDNTTTTGFEILQAPIPVLTISKGPKSPSDHEWDPEMNSPYNTMLQLQMSANDVDDIKITSMVLSADGTGNDEDAINYVKLVLDESNTGVYNETHTLLGFGKYIRDNSIVELNIEKGYTIKINGTAYFLVVYVMTNSSSGGDTFSATVASVGATTTSGKSVTITGTASSSVKTTFQTKCPTYTSKTSCEYVNCKWCDSDNSCREMKETCPTGCSGTPVLSLEKTDVVNATVSGMSNCDNKTIYLKQDSCSGVEVGSCSVSGSGCSASFSIPIETRTYYACLDKNDDRAFSSDEQTSSTLVIEKELISPGTAGNLKVIIIILVIVVVVIVSVILALKYKSMKSSMREFEELKKKWEKKE